MGVCWKKEKKREKKPKVWGQIPKAALHPLHGRPTSQFSQPVILHPAQSRSNPQRKVPIFLQARTLLNFDLSAYRVVSSI